MSTTENGNDAIAEALSRWLHNQLLRLTLDEIYDEQPDLRPTPERVAAMARRVGITVPFGGEWHSLGCLKVPFASEWHSRRGL